MTTDQGHDLIVIGGGAAGLAAARTGAGLGARTLLVAEGPIGGDCTFTGCVPSKTLIEHAARGASFAEAMTAVRDAVQTIAATETADVLRGEGIEVLPGRAVFLVGARPAVPSVPGLGGLPYLTSETVFGLEERPRSLAVLGGGTTGCELAQAFHRLGVRVDVVEAADRVLPGADPDASEVVADVLAREGLTVRTGAGVVAAEAASGGVRLRLAGGAVVDADRLLVAVGRAPATAGLGLDAAGVRTGGTGHVITDRRLATTARGVYAAGDVTGRLQLTHAAYAMGRVAARNALGGRRRAAYADDGVPWVVFTDPEVAQVGLTETEAGPDARVVYLPMTELDRAVTAGRTDGFVKLVAGPRRLLGHRGGGRLLGATIVAARAGEMIHEPALALRTGMFTGRLAQTVHAYPTWSIAVQQAAAQFFGGHGGRTARPPRSRDG
jgi:pyruvate/2-oxoglutarate dehydrogenase complex dihydrolipoamide dehydrogenase (E3) component